MAKRRKSKLPLALIGLFAVIVIAAGVVVMQRVSTTNEVSLETSLSANQKRADWLQKKAFIARIAPLAQDTQRREGVLSSITIGQAILESDWGNSALAVDYHNLFGVKSEDPKNSVSLSTKEYVNGQWITVNARFQTYPSDAASIEGHTSLFVKGTTWNPNQYAAVLAAKDYKTAAAALQSSGYATDPDYTKKIIQLIEEWGLDEYDKL